MFSWFKKKKEPTIKHEKKAPRIFDDTMAKEILHSIRLEYGLDYSKQEHITMRKMERFCIKNEIHDFSKLKEELLFSKILKEQLINMLTVGETYFYRETGHFKILADMMQQRSVDRILCAPSSSGEEAYSILLFLREQLKNISQLKIKGIDVNSDVIQSAKKGIYTKRSVSLLPTNILENNFHVKDEKYHLDQKIKSHIDFERKNIFDKKSLKELGKFDVIFCRNMLIYFNEQQKKEAIANLRELLEENGILFIGHADISFEPKGFTKSLSQHGTYFIK